MLVQIALSQSVPVAHVSPARHGAQVRPPQSASVSSPFFCESSHRAGSGSAPAAPSVRPAAPVTSVPAPACGPPPFSLPAFALALPPLALALPPLAPAFALAPPPAPRYSSE